MITAIIRKIAKKIGVFSWFLQTKVCSYFPRIKLKISDVLAWGIALPLVLFELF